MLSPAVSESTKSQQTFLKLFDAETTLPAPRSTLRECFTVHILPELIDEERAAATLLEYESMLGHWETLTDNPPVSQIDRAAIKAFRKLLIEKPYKRGKVKRKRSPATVNKILRTIKAAISPLWPADRHNPGGLGLVQFFKFPEPLPKQGRLPFVFNRAQMTALYEAAEACKIPGQPRRCTGLYNAALWRAAMVLALNAGPRTWDLYELRWDDIRWDDFKYGSIHFRARKTAKLQRVPLNRHARAHLLHLKSLGLDDVRVFPGFSKNKSFYAAWKRICAQAQVFVPFEAFRKTCSTLHEDTVGGTGEWITGHGVKGVNAENYQNPTNRVFKAVYSMKQPKAFRIGTQTLLALMRPEGETPAQQSTAAV